MKKLLIVAALLLFAAFFDKPEDHNLGAVALEPAYTTGSHDYRDFPVDHKREKGEASEVRVERI